MVSDVNKKYLSYMACSMAFTIYCNRCFISVTFTCDWKFMSKLSGFLELFYPQITGLLQNQQKFIKLKVN